MHSVMIAIELQAGQKKLISFMVRTRPVIAQTVTYIYIYISRLTVVSREAKEEVPRDERT